MTGFAREAGATGPVQWAWEMKTVNGRGLEVRLRVPPGLDSLGEEVRQAVSRTLSRGQCHVTLALSRGQGAARVRINRDLLASLAASLAAAERPAGIGPATLDGLLAVRGVVEVEEDGDDAAFDEALRRDLLDSALRLVAALQGARAGEGAALSDIITGQLDRMAQLVDEAEACPGRQPGAIRDRLAAQIATLLDSSKGLDPARLHQEAALLATRADIREELDRLRAHLAAARELLAQDAAIGRRLDFLAQEFGRETNTLCSKANDVALSRIGLELKAVVEQFREQVQNVE
ncbi:MAG: putative stress-induced protein [Enterovirga sp.]|nr:putative stress-induced protein [Enterovirga sp.]